MKLQPHWTTRKTTAALSILAVCALGACGGDTDTDTEAATSESSTSASASAQAAADGIEVENCGETVNVDAPVERMFINDGNIISIALAAGAREEIVAVTSLQRDKDLLTLEFGEDVVNGLNVVNDKYMTLENIVAADPEMVFAGWGYGFVESKNLTPDMLTGKGIETYLLTETCQKSDGTRGTIDAWEALRTDLTNMGKLTAHEDTAQSVVDDIDARLDALMAAPQPEDKPTVFLFDSARDAIFTSGKFGGPQAIFDAAGAKNATEDVEDTWTEVSWERLATSDPDVIFFVDYPGQSYDEKVEALKSNPASTGLSAVKEERFVNLPYAMWTSGPLNIDAAEYVRVALEHYELAPKSDVDMEIDLKKLSDLPGNEWLKHEN